MLPYYFQLINITVYAIIVLFFLFATAISFHENENKATLLFLLTGFFIFCVMYFLIFLNPFKKHEILLVLDAFIFIVFIVLFAPYKGKYKLGADKPKIQFDERDTIFSRKDLVPGSELFEAYYHQNPKNKKPDDEFRKKPGLLSPNATKYEIQSFSAANANFKAVQLLKSGIDGEINKTVGVFDEIVMQKFILNWIKKLGAHNVGITELKSYHLYHTKGRGETYNKKVINVHKYAIAFTVEMDKEMMDAAPDGPTVMESSQQYLNAGIIAVQVAGFIRELGYEAKAHIDGNYDLICPLVARDAGLGEIGRMGLLMTPKLGPRVRIAVITTNLPLPFKPTQRESSTIHFCEICKKCADNCPSKAISFERRTLTDNGLRWKIDSESCYNYWCIVGTDCGKCIQVCPFSHPNNIIHNFIRWGIKNNEIFRHLALKLDDFYYGRKPKKQIVNWMN